MGKKIVLCLVLSLLMTAVVLAGYQHKGSDIVRQYSTGEKIRGEINISFNNEPGGNLFTSNFNGSIKLLDLLEENSAVEGVDYDCSSENCLERYTLDGGVNSLDLSINDKKVVGLKVTGSDITDIVSVGFNVQSDVDSSCDEQLRIDVLGNDENELINKRHTSNVCSSRIYGCFNSGLGSYQKAVISSTDYYCENVTLPIAPAYRLGAKIKNSTNGQSSVLKMELYSFELDDFVGSCVLPNHTQENQELECDVEFSSSKQGKYLACVIASESGADYSIRTETSSPVCGTDNLGFSFSRDYEIFARPLKFDTIDMMINDSLLEGNFGIELRNYIFDYIVDNFGGNCIPNCVVPIEFSGKSQTLVFDDVEIIFKDGNTQVSDNTLYKVNTEEVTVSSEDLLLDLVHANFRIPLGSNAKKFELFLGGEKIFQVPINISESFSFDVEPKFVAFGQNVLFKAVSSGDVIESTWKFGDGNIETSESNEIRHKYLEQGSFEMEVEIVLSDGTSSTKVFSILVGDAKTIGNFTINEYNKRIIDLREDINAFSPWVKIEIEEVIDLSQMETLLDDIESRYNNASTDDDYNAVMLELIALDVPFAIGAGEKGKLPLLIGVDNIDVNYIKSLSGEEVDSLGDLKTSVVSWMAENYGALIDFEQIDAFYDDDTNSILTIIKIETKPKGNVGEAFLFLSYGIDGVNFRQDYGAKEISGGTYIPLNSGNANEVIEFVILDEIGPGDLGAYISPQISELGIFDNDFDVCNYNNICEEGRGEDYKVCRADCKPWGLFTLWISVLGFVALFMYIILQEWYKRFYEKSLFKTRNELYNIINFIYNSRRRGLTDSEIRRNLSNVGWKRERISYAMRKIDGKKTGMFEIPLFKFLENRKVKKELASRHQGRVDTRFIKRSGL